MAAKYASFTGKSEEKLKRESDEGKKMNQSENIMAQDGSLSGCPHFVVFELATIFF